MFPTVITSSFHNIKRKRDILYLLCRKCSFLNYALEDYVLINR